jgi:L-amino acid N-acyltransferase YncA
MRRPVRIRPATPDDAPALLAIYRPYVEATAVSFETAVPADCEFAVRIEKALAGRDSRPTQ